MKLSIQFLILALLISCQTQKKQESHDFSDLISEIDSIAAANRFNGVILISSDSSNVYSKAIGFSDIKNKTKIDINDQFVIGSISKQITAVLMLREVEKVNLNWTIQSTNT
jgi:CubicO group peptidase (beta-lactamase class C family)